MLYHFDLLGTRQVWLHLRGRDYEALPFRVPLLYKHVRHPLYIGWTIAFWAIPTMTAGHLLFAAVLTGYMILAVRIEERDLVAHFGHLYEEYRSRVPMFIPRARMAQTTAVVQARDPNSVVETADSETCRV
jgi:steroid 5-alpha reductase family enzyme